MERLALVVGRAAAWIFLAAVVVTVWEVGARYLFDRPTNWAHETTTTLCAIGFALGGAYAFARNEHIRITVVRDRFRPSARRALEILSLLLGVIYLAGLGYAAWGQASEAAWRFDATGWAPELTPGPPNWPLPTIVRVALAAGTLLFLAAVAQRLVAVIRGRAE
ncbi:TRAP transporter small permease subunit [Roseomonas sp. CCTCC AB2023176]|uniref:TRAP transporter small permease subunit n=1 Tax=Roseomonas sp. CCTCC AB2023176 TaxID=3342640 RepID=UPI0035D9DF7C